MQLRHSVSAQTPISAHDKTERQSRQRTASAQSETPDIETSSLDYRRRFEGAAGEYFLDVQATKVLRVMRAWPQASVLDVGGGHAQLAVPLVKNGFQVTVTGSDESCRARLDELLAQDSFEFCRCDLLDLPFEKNSFDVVVAFRLLTHLQNWARSISELCRVARKAVIVDYPDVRSLNYFYKHLFNAKKSFEGNTRPFYCFRREEILCEFERGNFDKPQFQPQFFVPMVVHRALRTPMISRGMESVARVFGLTRAFGSPVILTVTQRETDQDQGSHP